MKMVILEVSGNYAAALSEDGTISRIPNQNYRVGQELVRLVQKQKNRFTVYARRIAAVAAVFVFLLAGAHVFVQMPVSYVSLDVNPSVEYKLNLFNKVVEVVAVNEDAKELLKDTALVYQPADKAIKQTVELLGEKNYLKTEEKNDIVISASASDSKKSKAVLNTVTQATVEAAASIGVKAEIIVFESSTSDVKQAEKLGTTPGKMQLVNHVIEQDVTTMDPEIDDMEEVNNLLQMPVKELVSIISETTLMQVSESDDSVLYIQTDVSESTSSEENSDQTSSMVEIDVPVSEDTTTSEIVSSATENSSSAENALSSSESMDTSEIPSITPGLTASSSEDTTTSQEQENALNTSTSSESISSEALDTSEIPSVTPGIVAGDTSDVNSEVGTENNLETTTSAPEETVTSEKEMQSEASESEETVSAEQPESSEPEEVVLSEANE